MGSCADLKELTSSTGAIGVSTVGLNEHSSQNDVLTRAYPQQVEAKYRATLRAAESRG